MKIKWIDRIRIRDRLEKTEVDESGYEIAHDRKHVQIAEGYFKVWVKERNVIGKDLNYNIFPR